MCFLKVIVYQKAKNHKRDSFKWRKTSDVQKQNTFGKIPWFLKQTTFGMKITKKREI